MMDRKKRGKKKGKEFMDAVYEAYVRYVALTKWRDLEGMTAAGIAPMAALAQAGQFPERGRYRAIWEEVWQSRLGEAQPGPALLGLIETALSAALEREMEDRKRTRDRPVDEDPEFKGFVDRALDQLFAEEAGTLEEID